MPLTHWIPECHIYKFHTKPNMMTSLEGTNGIDGELECRLWTWIPFWLRLEIPRNLQIMSSFFVKIFADLSLVYHRWDFEFSRNLRRVMKIHCLQFKFNFAQKKVFLGSITKLEDTENINDSKSQVSNMLKVMFNSF